MITPLEPIRSERNIEWHLKTTSLTLVTCYKMLKHDEPAGNFIKAIQTFVETILDPSIESPWEIIMQFFAGIANMKSVDEIARSAIGPVIVGSVHVVRARRAMESNDLDLAWSYIADARHWCGISVCDRDVEIGLPQVINTEREKASAETLTSQGKAGVEAQEVVRERLRAYVYEEARRREDRWESRTHAVRVISKKAINFVHEEQAKAQSEGRKSQLPKIRGSLANFERTVDSWLRGMPDALSLFAAKNPKS